ncbi:MAG: alcohol acetyltransferase [Clostridia bacterium]|nr:alcohol acetyltransferase [Clostridia bacterium]
MTDVKKKDWFRLDNAATVFPGQNSEEWSNVFRLSVELKENIDPDLLSKALRNTLPRFPAFDVRIRKGFFWYYFEKNPNGAPPVMPDINNPCHRVKFKENSGYLFRVYYHACRISIDTFHSLADGHGAAVFMLSLTAEYLRLTGASVSFNEFVLNPKDKVNETELEDSFRKNADSAARMKLETEKCYHSGDLKLPKHNVNITSGIIDYSEFSKLIKPLGVTATEYLTALLLDIHIKKQAAENNRQRKICVQIPIDLRRRFISDTLRNFTICLRVVIDPNLGEYSFDELLSQTHHQLALASDKKNLNAMITAYLRAEQNPFLKITPLFIKDFGINIGFSLTAEQSTTALLTNLGAVSLPDDMKPYVEKLMFMPCPGLRNASRLGVATVNDKMVITFSDSFSETSVEREFFTHFVKKGLHVKIESNRY